MSFALAPAVADAAESAPGGWLVGAVRGDFPGQGSERWLYQVDVNARYLDVGDGVEGYGARGGIGYAVNDSTRVWAGYARFFARERGGSSLHENRLWQELQWRDADFLAGRLVLRLRAEQRDISDTGDVRHRGRMLARYQRPLASPAFDTWFMGGEMLLGINDSATNDNLNLSQHRLFAGVSTALRQGLRLETVLMRQYFWVDQGEDRVNYVGVVRFAWAF